MRALNHHAGGFPVVQTVQFMLQDATVLGLVAWGGLLVTVAGFVAAIYQIMKARGAAEAARDAAIDVANRIRAREMIIDVSESITFADQARSFLDAQNLGGAEYCVRQLQAALVGLKTVVELKGGDVGKIDDCLGRADRVLKTINRSLASKENINKGSLVHNLNKIRSVLHEKVSELRLDKGASDDPSLH